jgi:predicted neuraminidase
MNPVFLLAVVLAAASASSAAPPALLAYEFLYETAPFPSCHASTIAECNGGLTVAFFGGTAEKNPDVGIWVSRQEGGRWTAPVEVANGIQPDGKRLPCWNPVLFQPKTSPLLLFYKVGPSPETWWGLLRTSGDGGKTWSEPVRLPDGILGPIKNKPVQLADGSILCPTSTETRSNPSAWRVHFERTSDLGKTWSTSQPSSLGDPPLDAIQPSILLLGGEKLVALGRTRQKAIFQVASDDAGKTWGAMSLTTLPNPSSGIDAVTMKDGRHALVYNHTSKGRSPLNLAISSDARSWQAALVLESEPGEFSYPAVIQSSDGLLHVTYTWNRKRIRHATIDPAKLDLKPFVDINWPK